MGSYDGVNLAFYYMVHLSRHIGTKEKVVGGLLLLLIFYLSRFMKFSMLNFGSSLRGCDAWGCGSFGASRGGHKHRGLDFKVEPDENIHAPFPCEVIRHGYPYPDKSYRLIEIRGLDGYRDYTAKIMYVKDLPAVGSTFLDKQVICKADHISKRYDSQMVNHVHFELYAKGKLINPEIFF